MGNYRTRSTSHLNDDDDEDWDDDDDDDRSHDEKEGSGEKNNGRVKKGANNDAVHHSKSMYHITLDHEGMRH